MGFERSADQSLREPLDGLLSLIAKGPEQALLPWLSIFRSRDLIGLRERVVRLRGGDPAGSGGANDTSVVFA